MTLFVDTSVWSLAFRRDAQSAVPQVAALVGALERGDVVVTTGTSGSGFELAGHAVDLVEALSFRRPLEQTIPRELEWVFGGLGSAFDR